MTGHTRRTRPLFCQTQPQVPCAVEALPEIRPVPVKAPVRPGAAGRCDPTLIPVVVNVHPKLWVRGYGYWQILCHCPPFRRRASNSHTTPQHKTVAQTPTLKAVSSPNSVTFCLQFPLKPTRPRQRVRTRPTPRRAAKRCLRRRALLGHHENFCAGLSRLSHNSPSNRRSACVAAAVRPRGRPAVTPPPSAS